jgi:hypothetical protein
MQIIHDYESQKPLLYFSYMFCACGRAANAHGAILNLSLYLVGEAPVVDTYHAA